MSAKQDGIWMVGTDTLNLHWIGEEPIPTPTFRERCEFARIYMRSKGQSPRLRDWIKLFAKAIAFCLKPAHVLWSGKSYVTTGRSIEEEWANFNFISCVLPQSGQGNSDSLVESSSN